MTLPIIYLLLPEKSKIETELNQKYSGKYNVLHAHPGTDALNMLNEQERGALFLVHQSLPDMAGTEFFAKASALFPDSRKVLLAEAKETEAAITAINTLGIHYYLVQPWQNKHFERLDELLDDWQAISQPTYMYIKGVMDAHAARIREDSNLHIAAEIVALSGVSDLMVVNSTGGFIGVLSEGDILRAAMSDIDDILGEGGVTLIRAAAKNHERVTLVCDPADYGFVLMALGTHGEIPQEMRKSLAVKGFASTVHYDTAIHAYLNK